jgi:hypothetical protein
MEGASPHSSHHTLPRQESPHLFGFSPDQRQHAFRRYQYFNTDVINLTYLIGKSRGRMEMSLHSPSFPVYVGICRVPLEPDQWNFFTIRKPI